MDIDNWIEKTLNCTILSENAIRKLCRKVKSLLFQQGNVQPVQAPVIVCGDIHGQFYDLKLLFEKGGKIPNSRYIMLGDFVDRGYNSVQTVTLLFLYKVKYPDHIVLLRGNHQSRNITYMYGFYEQINRKYGNYNVWYLFNEVFDYLPIGAIIQGTIFCVHGGLSPKMNTIDHIRSIQRNIQIPTHGPLCDLMWSDPQDIQNWASNPRGAGWLFGKRVTEQFLRVNKLSFMVRAHQLVLEGYHKQFQQQIVTVWSAPNYGYRMNNKAAIMKLNLNLQSSFIVFQASPQSKQSTNYNSIIPYFL